MATRTFRGTLDSNWGLLGNWLEGAVPTSADDVIFDASSPACTVNASARVCKTINFTGYTNTITMTFGITVSGSITLVSAMTIAGTGSLTINATGTITSNTKVFPNDFIINGNITVTLADNFTVTGSLTTGAVGAFVMAINGNTLNVGGSLTLTNTGGTVSGTTIINLNGTGTWSNNTGINFANSVTINTAGTITFSGVVRKGGGTVTYTAGTVVTTGSTFYITASTTLNLNGISLNNFTVDGNSTVTLTSDLTVLATFQYGSGPAYTIAINGNSIYVGGNLTIATTGGGALNGTTVFVLNGTGTWSHTGTTSLGHFVTINTAGTITVTSTGPTQLSKLLYTAGTVTTAAGTWTTGGGGSVGFFIQ